MNGGPLHPTVGSPGLSRRSAIKLIAVGSLGVAAGVGATALITRMDRSERRNYFFFSPEEAPPLIALCEQLIPRDDTAGATDAGVITYIDRQLAGPLARHRGSYRAGLVSLQLTSQRLYQLPFETLGFGQQTSLAAMLEAGWAPAELWGEPSQKAFFNLVLDHTRQGFYGSPRHGGNRDYVSYRMLGLAYPNLIGQNRYPGAGRLGG
jgi:gluconate 2-dehydrogenase gamma chain